MKRGPLSHPQRPEALAVKERELAARDAAIHAKTLHIEKLRATLG